MYTDKKYVRLVDTGWVDATEGRVYELTKDGGHWLDDKGDERGLHPTSAFEFLDHKPFTKADLKNGMRCVSEDGSVYMYMDGYFYGKDGYLGSGIEEDLRCIHNHHCTINKVYEVPNKSRVMDLRITSILLWERPAPVEMTVADIEKALGRTIKVVK